MHTPGPWEVREVDGLFAIAHRDGWVLESNDEEQDRADARLIAAAPDMLEALRSAMRIKDLWLPIGDVSDEHAEEAKALSQMAMMFESVINKATTTDAAQTSAIRETQ